MSKVTILALLLHLYNNLLPQCVVCLPAPLLSYVPIMVTYESTVLVPHGCNGRAEGTFYTSLKLSHIQYMVIERLFKGIQHFAEYPLWE